MCYGVFPAAALGPMSSSRTAARLLCRGGGDMPNTRPSLPQSSTEFIGRRAGGIEHVDDLIADLDQALKAASA